MSTWTRRGTDARVRLTGRARGGGVGGRLRCARGGRTHIGARGVVLCAAALAVACGGGETVPASRDVPAAASGSVVPRALSSAEHRALAERFRRAVVELQETDSLPGAVAAYALPSGRVGVAPAGLSDPATGANMVPHSRFLAGSVGKTFAAATALALVGDGVLGLDDPVSDYLGAEPWFGGLPGADRVRKARVVAREGGLLAGVPVFRRVFEILADKFPLVDNALDAVQGLVKPVAGAFVMATVVTDWTPLYATVVCMIAGGTTAPGSITWSPRAAAGLLLMRTVMAPGGAVTPGPCGVPGPTGGGAFGTGHVCWSPTHHAGRLEMRTVG